MHAMQRRWILMILVFAVGIFSGCNSSDGIVSNLATDSNTQAEIEAGAFVAGVASPAAEATEQIVLGVAEQLFGPAASNDGPSFPTFGESVELANGITGSCDLDVGTGVTTCNLAGTMDVGGSAVSVDGSLLLSLSATQPSSGSAYAIDFDATAAGQPGTATWISLGSVTVSDVGQVTDHTLTMNHTILPTGGSTVVVTIVTTPSQFQLTTTGPYGGIVHFTLDRDTMSGTVSLNGQDVASVTFEGDCADINFFSESLQDGTYCMNDEA